LPEKREMTYKILKGNSLDLLPTLADYSIDAIVTDPPYELGFMGKSWDNSGIAYSLELWQQCLRVLKPGGHLLAFSGSRTYHRMVVSIEDAGFEIRDMISWISNKTFPKSLNIGKAIDKLAGVERKILGIDKVRGNSPSMMGRTDPSNPEYDGSTVGVGTTYLTEPATDEAKKWDGWGTGLKPTVEPIVMARKPVEGTVANNVLTYGTGGLNIDASRIGTEERTNLPAGNKLDSKGVYKFSNDEVDAFNGTEPTTVQGRWPANLILDEYTAELLDEQSGQVRSNHNKTNDKSGLADSYVGGSLTRPVSGPMYSDLGGASRFFYVAKASKRDRNEGLEDLPDHEWRDDGAAIPQRNDRPFLPSKNHHPTVKPTALMQYLVKLITPPGGTVLDPFTGSGSTGKAAILEGFDFIGIELTEDYWPIIEGRLKHAEAKVAEAKKNTEAQPQGLF
jgi:site-specific DNA-methyltransferase (adenine-specific)